MAAPRVADDEVKGETSVSAVGRDLRTDAAYAPLAFAAWQGRSALPM